MVCKIEQIHLRIQTDLWRMVHEIFLYHCTSRSQTFKANYSLFTKGGGQSLVVLFVYVDDIIIASPSAELISQVKHLEH